MIIKKGYWKIKSLWKCICGKNFEVENGRAEQAIKLKQEKYCSKDCKLSQWKKFGAKRLKEHQKKFGHPNFQGGVGITTDGYVWIRLEGRFHNQMKLHRYLMEVKLGRQLKSSEIVHHINEDKFDNRIENLLIVTRTEHNHIHKFLQKER